MTSITAESLDSIQFGAARSDLARLCSRAEFGSERIIITRHRRPCAALVPMTDLERLRAVDMVGERAESTVSIARPLADVWDAFVDPNVPSWTEDVVLFLRVGGDVVDLFEDGEGEVLDLVPRRLVRFDWPGHRGEVEIRLWATDSGTDISVVHRMDADYWDRFLERWRAYMEAQS